MNKAEQQNKTGEGIASRVSGNKTPTSASITPRQAQFSTSKRYTARGLRRLPTISQGQFSNLKIDDGKHRVWLSRMTIADGAPYNNAIEVEALLDGVWTSVAQYPGA